MPAMNQAGPARSIPGRSPLNPYSYKRPCDSDTENGDAAPISGLTDWGVTPGLRTRRSVPVRQIRVERPGTGGDGGNHVQVDFSDSRPALTKFLFKPGTTEHFGAGLMA